MNQAKQFCRFVDLNGMKSAKASDIENAINTALKALAGDAGGPAVGKLNELFARGIWTIDEAALDAGCSTRTLQRVMLTEGIAYGVLRDIAKARQAITLLSDPTIAIADVSKRLHFTHRSGLHVATVRWTGVNPARLRALLTS